MADQATKIYQELNVLTKQLTDTTKAYANVLKGLVDQETQTVAIGKESIKTIRDLIKAQESFAKNTKAVEEAERQLIKTESLRAREQEKVNRELLKTKTAQDKVKKSANDLNGAYRKASAELTTARNKAKDLAIQYGVTSKQFKTAASDLRRLDTEMKRIDAAVGQNQRSVGNYQKALGGLKNVLGAAGIVGGVQLFVRSLKNVIEIGKQYEKQNAVLAGVLGKTLKETKALQDESKRLGATTAFSASQVTELQIELARLGKSEQEIIASTEGIIDATIALGSETGETAALVGATLNAFNLGAEQSSKVADVLTLSTQKSALSFEKLNVALPIVGGAAAAAGIKLETVVAQLGQASDRGIDASTAATALRNIYIELSAKGLTLEEALNKINSSQNKLTTANELFGKRSAVTAIALADNAEKTKTLDEALQNAGGTAKKVAETQLNTLDGQLKLLNSAWEGLVLNINDSETALGRFSVNSVKFLTATINQFANLGKEAELLTRSLITGFNDTDDALLNYLIDTGRIEDSNGNIISVKEVLDSVYESYKNLDEETKELIDLHENLALALIKAGGEAEAVDRIAELYIGRIEQQNALLNHNKEIIDENVESVEELSKTETDLIKIQEKLLEQAKELPGTTEQEIAVRNTKIQIIEEEIRRLKALIDVQKTSFEPLKTRAEIAISTENNINMAVKASAKIFEDAEKAKTQIALEEAQRRKEINDASLEAGFESAQIIGDQLFQNAQIRRDNETQAELDALNQRLENETLDEEQRELIQKQIREKEKKAKTDQAKADKKAAITQSIVNTALSIGKTAATIPFPAAIPFIAFAAATGLAQTIAIASQPLPKFDKGTKNFPGLGWVAERRPELVMHNGVTELFTKPTILGNEYKGDEVIGGVETAKMLDQMTRQELINNVSNHSDNVQNMMIANAVTKAFEKHSNRMVDELRKNRPVKNSIDYRTSDLRRSLRD